VFRSELLVNNINNATKQDKQTPTRAATRDPVAHKSGLLIRRKRKSLVAALVGVCYLFLGAAAKAAFFGRGFVQDFLGLGFGELFGVFFFGDAGVLLAVGDIRAVGAV